MGPPEAQRRLAAILAADVVGYSRLMQGDDQATLAALTERRALFSERVAGHGGRIVNAPGDSVLAEFPSALQAVECAVQIQRALAAMNADLAEDRRMRFRIGVNLGDVLADAQGVYGDGVNIAARLESLAAPGEICISRSVQEQVANRIALDLEDLGDRSVKNISAPVRAFRIAPEGSVAARPALPLPDKPSLAVLAFDNLTGDPQQAYFADGVVDDIITALSRIRWFFVIARNSSFSYKGKAVDVKQVGRELGVRYVLEGSLRKAGNRVRITAQLVEAENGRHVWADRFEGSLEDIFELQDRLTGSVVAAIEPNLRRAEIERSRSKRTQDLQAYDCYLRALPHLTFAATRAATDEGLSNLRRALKLDPGYTTAKAALAIIHVIRWNQGWATEADWQEGLRLAEEVATGPCDDPESLARAGMVLAAFGHRYDQALQTIERAMAINPDSPAVLAYSGYVRCYTGDSTTAIDHLRRAVRLNPLDPANGVRFSMLAVAHLAAGKNEEALAEALRAVRVNPYWTVGYRAAIFCLVELGRLEEAQSYAKRALELAPSFSIATFRRTLGYTDEAFKDRYASAMRAAGLPE